MASCFALVGARQHCVAKISIASQRANAHQLQIDSFTEGIKLRTLTSFAPWYTLCHITCFRTQEVQIVTIGVSKSKNSKEIIDWNNKYGWTKSGFNLTAWLLPCFKNAAYQIWKTYGPKKYINERLNNCKGPHTISAANLGSTRDLISQKNA